MKQAAPEKLDPEITPNAISKIDASTVQLEKTRGEETRESLGQRFLSLHTIVCTAHHFFVVVVVSAAAIVTAAAAAAAVLLASVFLGSVYANKIHANH